VQVLEEERLDQFSVTLSHNESWRGMRALTPTMVGDRLRLVFLLYRGDAPAEPTIDNAYRHTHLLVNVTQTTR